MTIDRYRPSMIPIDTLFGRLSTPTKGPVLDIDATERANVNCRRLVKDCGREKYLLGGRVSLVTRFIKVASICHLPARMEVSMEK